MYSYMMWMSIVIIFPGRVPHRGWIIVNSFGTLMAANFFVHRYHLPVDFRDIKFLLYLYAGFLQIIDIGTCPDRPPCSKIIRPTVAIGLTRRCGPILRIKDLWIL